MKFELASTCEEVRQSGHIFDAAFAHTEELTHNTASTSATGTATPCQSWVLLLPHLVSQGEEGGVLVGNGRRLAVPDNKQSPALLGSQRYQVGCHRLDRRHDDPMGSLVTTIIPFFAIQIPVGGNRVGKVDK